jgi:hypothetical protein
MNAAKPSGCSQIIHNTTTQGKSSVKYYWTIQSTPELKNGLAHDLTIACHVKSILYSQW